MDTTIYLATGRGLTVIAGSDGKWRGKVCLEDKQVQCVVADSNIRGFVYCGTFGDGLFISENGGATWKKSASFTEPKVTALACPRTGSLYAGTELSAVYHSGDQGETWQVLETLLTLPSAKGWSFLRDRKRIAFSRFFQI
jgi:ligand-binding sensor domain-containing protein